MVLIPVLVLGVIALFAFAGCGKFDAAPETPAPPPPGTTPPGTTPPGTTPTPQTHPYPGVITARSSLRNYWRLGEANGALKAADSEPVKPLEGTYHGNIARADGALRLGNDANDFATSFDGDTAWVEVSYDPDPNPPQAFSVEAWVRPDPADQGTKTVVCSYEPQDARGYLLQVKRTSAGVTTAIAGVGDGTNFKEAQVDLGDGTVDGGWRHVTMTYSLVTKTLIVYADYGATHVSDTKSVDYVAVKPNKMPPLRIGAGRDESNNPAPLDPPSKYFWGRIDEVAIYDEPLPAVVVQDHADKARTL
jgi:hypothetical protein